MASNKKGVTIAGVGASSTAAAARHHLVEMQAIIMAGGGSAELFPILESKQSVSLLPLVNRPLLYYQLRLLESAGFGEVIIACEDKKLFQEFLSKQSNFKIKVELFVPKLDGDWASGNVLKQLGDKIYASDFLVLSGDVVSEISIHELADVHRTKDATATILLKENDPLEKTSSKTAPMFSLAAAMDKDVKTCFGLQSSHTGSDARVVYMKASEREDGACMISRNLLDKCPNFLLHANFTDPHVYIFKRWVLDLINQVPEFNTPTDPVSMNEFEDQGFTIKDDLLPYLVSVQFRKDFRDKFPEVYAKAKSNQSLAHMMSSAGNNVPPADTDRIRVYSFLSPFKKGGSLFCARANTLEAYSYVSFALMEHAHNSATTPWEAFVSNPPADDSNSLPLLNSDAASQKSTNSDRNPKLIARSMLGVNCVVHPSANLSKCIIGDNCYIGAGVKMSNCILLNNSRVEDGSILKECVFAAGVVVGRKSELSKCQVGPKYVFEEESEKSKTEIEVYVNDAEDLY